MATRTTKPRQNRSQQQGARPAGGGPKKKPAGWLWFLLGLLALALVAIAFGWLLLGSGDDPEPSGNAQPAQPAQTAPEPTTATPSGGAADPGTLTAAGTALLPVPAAGLAASTGDSAQGDNVEVQSVVKDEGFWVGSSAQDRVYVEYGGDVGEDEAQRFVPKVGDGVNLTGPVRPAPQNPAQTLNLPAADAQTVTEQGAYINADTVETR